MKNSIPRYTFYKHKYGSELLVDVVELKYVKKFLTKSTVHTLNYYDITFITEGKGAFAVDNQTYVRGEKRSVSICGRPKMVDSFDFQSVMVE